MADSAEPDGDTLVLSGPLTAKTVMETRQRMLRLDGGAACVIRAAEVTQLDAAGAQLLYAFVTEVTRRGAVATWASASVFLMEAARMLGMAGVLGLDGLPEEVTSWQP
jgi:ABC-type transporter Mla MlaB component